LDARRDALYYEFQKYKVMTMSVVGGQQKKKHENPSYEATKWIECPFLSLILFLDINSPLESKRKLHPQPL